MSEAETRKPPTHPQNPLARVNELLRRQRLVENLTHRQQGDHHELVESLEIGRAHV